MEKEQEMQECYVMQLGKNRCMNTYMHHVEHEMPLKVLWCTITKLCKGALYPAES